MDEIANLNEEIIKEAHEKALEILEKAQKRAETIIQEAEEKAKNKRKVTEEQIRKKEAITIQREVSKVKVNEKLKLSNLKESIIETVIQESLDRIKEMVKSNSNEYQKALRGLIVKGGRALEGGELVVQVKKNDLNSLDGVAMGSEITKVTNNVTTVNLVTSKDDDFIGGAIIIKGSLMVDNTIEAILERKKRILRNELHKILFEEA